jgi:hypothetical protein
VDWPKILSFVRAHGIRADDPPITQTTGGQHAPGGYHPRGQAEDFGTVDSDPVAVAVLLRPLVRDQPGLIVELLCDVNGINVCVLNGRACPWPSDALRRQHAYHCHVAIAAGATFPAPAPSTQEAAMARFNLIACVRDRQATDDAQGRHAFWGVDRTGGVFAFNGARPIKSLASLNVHRDDVVDVELDPDGNGLTLFADDGHQEGTAWKASTFDLRVGA